MTIPNSESLLKSLLLLLDGTIVLNEALPAALESFSFCSLTLIEWILDSPGEYSHKSCSLNPPL